MQHLASAMTEHLNASTAMLNSMRNANSQGGMGLMDLSDPSKPGAAEAIFDRMPSAKGAQSMEAFRQVLRKNPTRISTAIRANLHQALVETPIDSMTDADPRVHSAREYLSQMCGFDKARGITYVAYGLASVLDLMRHRQWEHAEAQALLLLAAIEQSLIDRGRWQTAWLMTHLSEPPWHRISHPMADDQLRPYAKLLDPTWAAAAAGYAKDMSDLAELKKRNAPAAPKPEEPAAGAKKG